MCDRNQEQLFAAVGRTWSPFAGVANWPWLEDVIAQQSRKLLDKVGDEMWQRAGGRIDEQTGEPTFRKNARVVSEIVRKLADKYGGMLYRDKRGVGWAVRLLPGPGNEREIRLGLGVTWFGNPRLADPEARDDSLKAVQNKLESTGPDEDRRRLEQLADLMRLYNRAEQLLWLIYDAVRKQRSSVVVLPDEKLAGAIWGGHNRPRNWRQHIYEALTSLSGLAIEQLHVTRGGWSPRLDMKSIAVASVKRLEPTPSKAVCDVERCPLRGSDIGHGHFVVQIGLGFLGVLERHAVQDAEDHRVYDFEKSWGNAGKEIKEAQREGRLVTVNLPVKIFGSAKWSELSVERQRIIQALIREVTRPVAKKGAAHSDRNDGAEVIVGNRVPGRSSRQMVTCPLLPSSGTYVAFNGNGQRRGLGYRIVGGRRTGWLHKCGYNVSGERRSVAREVRRFLDDLRAVAPILGLTSVGYHRGTKSWADFERLRTIARQRKCLTQLEQHELRIFGPPDYQDRLRRHLEEHGRLLIPKLDDVVETREKPPVSQDSTTIRQRMHQLGMTHERLAKHLGCSQQFVTQVLNGKRPWPARTYDRAAAYLGECESGNGRGSAA
jgi:hypothetical protein